MEYNEADGLEQIDFDIKRRIQLLSSYKQDLKDYITAITKTEGDSFDRKVTKRFLINQLVNKWYAPLGFDLSVIKRDIEELQAPPKKYKDSYNIQEIIEAYNPENNWIIPQLFRSAGLYIVAGEPKVGKSIFGYHLAYAVAISHKFLNRPVRGGRVLYLQLEEDTSTIAERVHFVGFSQTNEKDTVMRILSDPNCVTFDRIFDAMIDIPKLHKRIAELNPVMVIIDSLRASTINSNISEKDSEFGKIVAAMQQVFNQTDTCGILIHHMNKEANKTPKNKERNSLVNAISGSTAIASNSSGIIGLFANENEYSDPNSAKPILLRTLPRNGMPISITYSQTIDDDGIWQLTCESESTVGDQSLTAKIVRFLAQNPDNNYSPNEISKGTGLPLEFAFKQSLSFLVSTQVILYKNIRGSVVYCFPKSSLWMVNKETANQEFSPTVVDANAIMQTNNKRELFEVTKDWTADRRKAAKKVLMTPELIRLSELATTYLFSIDQIVNVDGMDGKVINLGEASVSNTMYTIEFSDGTVKEINEWEIESLQEFVSKV